MAVFLYEPRYAFGCLGFYTERLSGKRILLIGAFITGLAVIAAFFGGISSIEASPGAAVLFLVISAWVLVFGLMRLFLTGVMWIFTQVADWIAGGVASFASTMHFLRRAYWIASEIFLSTAFLATLIVATLVGFGVLSIKNEEAGASAFDGGQRSNLNSSFHPAVDGL